MIRSIDLALAWVLLGLYGARARLRTPMARSLLLRALRETS